MLADYLLRKFRLAKIAIRPELPGELDLDRSMGELIGFSNGGKSLSLVYDGALVKHEARIVVSFSQAAVRDLLRGPLDGETVFEKEVPVLFDCTWRPKPWFRRLGIESDGATCEAKFRLCVRPEAARWPAVRFEQGVTEGEGIFELGKSLPAGRFFFLTAATRRFALPHCGSYDIVVWRQALKVQGRHPFRLEPSEVTVVANGREVVAAVSLYCDGTQVVNPTAQFERIDFRLQSALGFPPNDEGTPNSFRLLRNTDRTEVTLLVTPLIGDREEHEINWAGLWEDRPRLTARLNTGPRADSDVPFKGDTIDLGHPYPVNIVRNAQPQGLLEIKVFRTSPSTEGVVEVRLQARLELAPDAALRLHLRGGFEPNDLLSVASQNLILDDTHRNENAIIQVEPDRVLKIDGTEILSPECKAVIVVSVAIQDGCDCKELSVTLTIPIRLKQEPGPVCLVIDAGTSAIAAAVGTIGTTDCIMLDLQKVPVIDGMGVGANDSANPESGTRLLPSWVICNGDTRTKQDNPMKAAKGHPLYHPGSLLPGDAEFVGLPAYTSDFREQPKRVVFALKSWLGTSAHALPMQTPISFKRSRNSQPAESEYLPLDGVVESGFAALSSAYLRPALDALGGLQPDQVILCHPNSFTSVHQDRLRGIAKRALFGPLHLEHSSSISLISESDAVAYYYCNEARLHRPRTGEERILVYDFGAGTLDVTFLLVRWNEKPSYPVELGKHRLGVPVAGNHLDELLARLVDKRLRQPGVLAPPLDYRFPIVNEVDGPIPDAYGQAIRSLWLDIRKAKHSWNGSEDLRIPVGNLYTTGRIVAGQPAPSDSHFELDSTTGELHFRIPAKAVHSDPHIEEFLRFVTEDVVDETLRMAHVDAGQIDTLYVSGRGALWPGLRERLRGRLTGVPQGQPDGHFPNLPLPADSRLMKEAVVRGALAKLQLSSLLGHRECPVPPRVGIIYGQGTEFEMIDGQGGVTTVDLLPHDRFRVVQIACAFPDPRNDDASLRRHFYIDLAGGRKGIDSRQLWGVDRRLRARCFGDGGRFRVELLNNSGTPMFIDADMFVSPDDIEPPWPMGNPVLRPKPEPRLGPSNAAGVFGGR
jgi:hypothetical protein